MTHEAANQFFVEGLGEARICNGAGDAIRPQLIGGGEGFCQTRSQTQDGDFPALAHDATLAEDRKSVV